MPAKLVLAIDPGGTTGIAVRDGLTYNTCICTELHEVWDLVRDFRTGLAQVIIEQFTTSANISKYGLHTVRLIGGVQALCHVYDLPLQLHAPVHRHRALPRAREMLKGKGATDHEIDALAHLLSWEGTCNR